MSPLVSSVGFGIISVALMAATDAFLASFINFVHSSSDSHYFFSDFVLFSITPPPAKGFSKLLSVFELSF